jgi:hypothetical protein
MALPEFNATGDLPHGVHRASWIEIFAVTSLMPIRL